MQPQPVVMMASQQQYVPAAVASRTPKVYDKYSVKQATVLGALQVTFGVLSIAMQIGAIVVKSEGAVVGVGIWCGVFFVIAGGLGLGSAKHRTLGLIVATMVMSILAAILCIAQLVYGSIAFSLDRFHSHSSGYFNYVSSYGYYSGYVNPYHINADWGARQAMSIILLVLSLLEAAVAIWQSALCCAACCCTSTAGYVHSPAVQYRVVGPGQHVVAIPGQAGMIYQQQPVTGVPIGQPFQPQGYPVQQPAMQVTGPGVMPPPATAGYAPPPQAIGNPPPYASGAIGENFPVNKI